MRFDIWPLHMCTKTHTASMHTLTENHFERVSDELDGLPGLILINVNFGSSASCCCVVPSGKEFRLCEPRFPLCKVGSDRLC